MSNCWGDDGMFSREITKVVLAAFIISSVIAGVTTVSFAQTTNHFPEQSQAESLREDIEGMNNQIREYEARQQEIEREQSNLQQEMNEIAANIEILESELREMRESMREKLDRGNKISRLGRHMARLEETGEFSAEELEKKRKRLSKRMGLEEKRRYHRTGYILGEAGERIYYAETSENGASQRIGGGLGVGEHIANPGRSITTAITPKQGTTTIKRAANLIKTTPPPPPAALSVSRSAQNSKSYSPNVKIERKSKEMVGLNKRMENINKRVSTNFSQSRRLNNNRTVAIKEHDNRVANADDIINSKRKEIANIHKKEQEIKNRIKRESAYLREYHKNSSDKTRKAAYDKLVNYGNKEFAVTNALLKEANNTIAQQKRVKNHMAGVLKRKQNDISKGQDRVRNARNSLNNESVSFSKDFRNQVLREKGNITNR